MDNAHERIEAREYLGVLLDTRFRCPDEKLRAAKGLAQVAAAHTARELAWRMWGMGFCTGAVVVLFLWVALR